jgi:WD40 repeat protein
VGPVRVAPDGRRLAALSARTSDVFVWDAVTAEARALVGHTSWVNDVAWIGSDRLATTGEDGTVRLWDLAGTRTWSIATKGPGNHIRLSADGEWIFAAGVDWIRAFHLPTARVVDLGPLRGRVTTIEVARQGLTLAAGFESGGALVWSEPGAEPKLLYARAVPTSALAFDATGRTLAIAAVDGWLAQWDLGTGEHRDLRKASPDELGHQFRTVLVGWSPDGELFFTGGSNDPTVLWSDELPREPAALREWLGGLRGR